MREAGIEWRDLLALDRGDVARELALPLPWLAGAALGIAQDRPLVAFACAAVLFMIGLRLAHGAFHRALGLSPAGDHAVLLAVSVLLGGSAHAIRVTHLHHHRACLAGDDVEGRIAHERFRRALAASPSYPLRIHAEALRRGSVTDRVWIAAELAAAACAHATLALAAPGFAPKAFSLAMLAANALAPMIGIWAVHRGGIARTCRARWLNRLTAGMLHHDEHHRFPAVPTRRLAELARRLDAQAAHTIGVGPPNLFDSTSHDAELGPSSRKTTVGPRARPINLCARRIILASTHPSGTRMLTTLRIALFIFSVAGSAAAVAAESDAPFGAASPRLAPCRLPNVAREARCGRFEVPENPAKPHGQHIPIEVAVLPAKRAPAMRDPIAFLSGGPGEAARDAAADIDEELAGLAEDRDLLFVDQRGTGRSNRLPCDLYLPKNPGASLVDVFPLDAIRRCVEELGRRADLTQYSYARFADDLERVRRELGYGPLNLFGLSYGTRAAQVYLHAYPASVRTAYLGSVVPIDVATPLPFARAAQEALDATFAACERDAACSAAYPNLRAEAKQMFARLASGGVRVTVPKSQQTVTLNPGRIAERLRSILYKPEGAALVPWAIHRAYLGDWMPFAEGILGSASMAGDEIAFGVFFTITCNEDVAFIREADVAPAVAGSYLGDYRVRQQQAACALWPKYSLPDGYRDPVRTDVPTLIVSGDIDPATPLWMAEHAAQGFSHRAEIVLRGQAHTGWSACVERAYAKLVRSGSVDGIETECEATPRPAFKIDS